MLHSFCTKNLGIMSKMYTFVHVCLEPGLAFHSEYSLKGFELELVKPVWGPLRKFGLFFVWVLFYFWLLFSGVFLCMQMLSNYIVINVLSLIFSLFKSL